MLVVLFCLKSLHFLSAKIKVATYKVHFYSFFTKSQFIPIYINNEMFKKIYNLPKKFVSFSDYLTFCNVLFEK